MTKDFIYPEDVKTKAEKLGEERARHMPPMHKQVIATYVEVAYLHGYKAGYQDYDLQLKTAYKDDFPDKFKGDLTLHHEKCKTSEVE